MLSRTCPPQCIISVQQVDEHQKTAPFTNMSIVVWEQDSQIVPDRAMMKSYTLNTFRGRRLPCRSAKPSILNAQFLVFHTKFLVFDTQYLFLIHGSSFVLTCEASVCWLIVPPSVAIVCANASII